MNFIIYEDFSKKVLSTVFLEVDSHNNFNFEEPSSIQEILDCIDKSKFNVNEISNASAFCSYLRILLQSDHQGHKDMRKYSVMCYT